MIAIVLLLFIIPVIKNKKYMKNIDRLDIARVAMSQSTEERGEYLKKIMLFYGVSEEQQSQTMKHVFTQCISFWKNVHNDNFRVFLRHMLFVILGTTFSSWALQADLNLPPGLVILLKVLVGLIIITVFILVYKQFLSMNNTWKKIDEFEKLLN